MREPQNANTTLRGIPHVREFMYEYILISRRIETTRKRTHGATHRSWTERERKRAIVWRVSTQGVGAACAAYPAVPGLPRARLLSVRNGSRHRPLLLTFLTVCFISSQFNSTSPPRTILTNNPQSVSYNPHENFIKKNRVKIELKKKEKTVKNQCTDLCDANWEFC